jgi:hypothetical protein
MKKSKKQKGGKEGAGTGPRKLPRAVIFGGAAVLLAAGIFAALASRPRYVWYVEEGLESEWRRVINTAAPPRSFQKEPVLIRAGEKAPSSPGGFVITTIREKTEEPVTVYPRLSFVLEHEGAQVLALDPWMIFRNHQFPALPRSRVEAAGGGTGLLLIPGRDPAAVRAWTARLVQEAPGEFPADQAVWDAARTALFSGGRFQRGAETFNWSDVWAALLGDDTAWTYAPMSRVRDLPNYRASILEASPFPEPGGANAITLQARILWALPAGNAKTRARLAKRPREWLQSAKTQTIIADTLRWLPANPEGQPYDPAAMSARLAWLTASFVWEDGRMETLERP